MMTTMKIVTHRVLTKAIEPALVAHEGSLAPKAVSFSIQTTKIKEVINLVDVTKILEADNMEKEETKEKTLSREEQKFIRLWKKM